MTGVGEGILFLEARKPATAILRGKPGLLAWQVYGRMRRCWGQSVIAAGPSLRDDLQRVSV